MENDTSSNLIWFAAGLSIGASVALLFAPKPGKDTRRLIADKSREGADAVAGTSRDMYERGRALYERGRKIADEAAEMLEHGKEIVEKAVSAIEEDIQKAAQA